LNAELARAAMELAENMENESADDTADIQLDATDEITTNLAAHSSTEITAEITAKLVGHGDAVNDEQITDLDDTSTNEDLTAELLESHDDVTVEMDVEGGRIDTKKKSRAS
jgi:hypothetical protein